MSRLRRTILAALAALLLGGASASAIKGEIGGTTISATATMLPRELPARGGAPITLSSVTRINNRDGSTPQKLSTIDFLIDRHASVDARGVPVCTVAKLAGTTPGQARRRCRGALVGKGAVRALVDLPGQVRTTVSSPVSFFNGPKRGGLPSLIAHAYETLPASRALLVEIEIERVSRGRYGYRVEVELPPIAAGHGTPILAEATVGKTRKRGARRVGYLNARCAGARLQVKGRLSFENGDLFPALLTSPCHLPG